MPSLAEGEEVEEEAMNVLPSASEDMKIAWRYKDKAVVQVSFCMFNFKKHVPVISLFGRIVLIQQQIWP